MYYMIYITHTDYIYLCSMCFVFIYSLNDPNNMPDSCTLLNVRIHNNYYVTTYL